MSKTSLITLFSFLLFACSFGQAIDVKVTMLGYRFTQDGERLSWKELEDVTQNVPEAHLLIKKAKVNRVVGNVLAGAGGVFLGIPLGQSFVDKDPNWNLAYVSGGLYLISLPFSLSAFNKMNEGIKIFNTSLDKAAFQPELNVIANRYGYGIALRF